MAIQNSTHIFIDKPATRLPTRPITSLLGNSAVLDSLLPELSIWQKPSPKQEQDLKNIDSYMLLETKQVLERVASILSNLKLSHTLPFTLNIQRSGQTTNLLIKEDIAINKKVVKAILQDKWLMGAFEWLCPNYLALAHSQELLTFSHAYKEDNQAALLHYHHLQQPEPKLKCYLTCRFEQRKPKLTWHLDSPKTSYCIKELEIN
ncbi:hypothetical protein [Paraglaciecola sp. 2405UD69-4]|uniref:hypothetical protein n=1 Tax=Paraglaciecola sp. 2405UD69-4 TaxID=3391836 RepID=UPI0039C98E66